MLDLQRLHVLDAVAREGSFSAAARSLHITPSAVSQQIAALERSIGVPVVTRGARGARLTEAGELLAQTAATVAADLAQVERHLAGHAQGRRGQLTVATFSSAGQTLLPRALAPLTGRPDVDVTVHEADVDESIPLLRAGEVDLALVCHFFAPRLPDEWARDLRYTPLVCEQMYAVLPDRHALADRERIALRELSDEWWLAGSGYCGEQVDQFCLAAGFSPKTACRSADYTFAQTLVAGGVGVALVPAVAIAHHLSGIRVVPVDPVPVRYVGVAQRRERWQSPLARELVRLLRKEAGSLDVPGVTAQV